VISRSDSGGVDNPDVPERPFRSLESPCLRSNLDGFSEHMKLTSFVWRSLAGVACMAFMLGTAAGAEKKSASKIKSKESVSQSRTQSAALKPRVILVQVTGSWIPQRVVVYGQQANSASPLYVVQGEELRRNGGVSVFDMLALDPSITRR